MKLLHATLFGRFELVLNGQRIADINSPRLQSLLAYLMLHSDDVLPRRQIAAVFWPDETDAHARNNLRQFLHQLRQALPDVDHYLRIEASTLQWSGDASFHLDVAAFESAIAQAVNKLANHAEMRQQLEQAVSLYDGDLLPNCYDDWIVPERERLRQVVIDALKRLIELLENQRDITGSIPHAQRLYDFDPLDEDANATLIRLHALNNDRSAALRSYQAHAATLKRELGIEPSPDLQAAHERLLHSDAAAQTSTPPLTGVDVVAPLIGRQPEWETLRHVWQAPVRAQTRMVLVSGEAGIGKTRLTEELMHWLGQQGINFARTCAYAAEGGLAYSPVTEWLRSPAIRRSLTRLDKVWLSEVARIVPELLAERPDIPQPAPMSDQSQRQRFFEALARAVLATRQPLLLVIDNLQWCDLETLEWLRFLLRFDTSAKLLVVGTARSEEADTKHPLTRLLLDLHNANQLTEIELKRLDAAESAHLASYVLSRPMELSEAAQLYRDTEGNPLFVVEMARASRGADGQGSRWAGEPAPVLAGLSAHLPPKVQAIITGRLAQLSDAALEVVSLGATMGRAFSVDVLAKASEADKVDEENLLHSLDELWQRRIVRAQDANANTYDFTHDKLREVAYGQLSPAKRRLLHRRAAQAIEAMHAADLDPVSAQLAAHYEQAGMYAPAITFYLRAAKVAQRLFANEEVTSLTNRGLALLPLLGPNNERDEYEFELLTVLSIGLGFTAEYRVPEQTEALMRAQMLGQRLGRPPHASILRMLATNHIVRANYDQSMLLSEQLLQLAQQLHDPILRVEGYEALGITHFWMGTFEKSRTCLEWAIAQYDAKHSGTHITQFAWDSKVICLCRLALGLWCLGYPDQAIQTQQSSLEMAKALEHPHSSGYSMFWDALLKHMLGNVDQVRRQTEATIEFSLKSKMMWWLRQATTLHSWAMAIESEHDGITSMRSAIDDFYELGTVSFMRPYYVTLLAQLCVKQGQLEQCWELLGEAKALTDQTNERWYESEMQRVCGDVLLTTGADAQKAEKAFRQAIETAQVQQAKSFELRAVTSLARLWQSQGKIAEACDLLVPIYGWFTEGFDTHDLKEAKALLNQLTIY